jgi:hypothetical protein
MGTSSSTETVNSATDSDSEDEEIHYYCCDPDKSLCGLDLEGEVMTEEGPACVFCEAVDDLKLPCVECKQFYNF